MLLDSTKKWAKKSLLAPEKNFYRSPSKMEKRCFFTESNPQIFFIDVIYDVKLKYFAF